ncbi:hypothetical protein [Streptomyces violaceorubidus]|uniref:Uncharacterized protein n=1 Tax=Streptomyces violaceorubidus TaxID=284042 RepID=A0ABV1SZI4_9ACTN
MNSSSVGETAPVVTHLGAGGRALTLSEVGDSSSVGETAPVVTHLGPGGRALTLSEVGDSSSVGQIAPVVTHLGPFPEPPAAVDRAATHYDGPVEHAAPGRTVAVR